MTCQSGGMCFCLNPFYPSIFVAFFDIVWKLEPMLLVAMTLIAMTLIAMTLIATTLITMTLLAMTEIEI